MKPLTALFLLVAALFGIGCEDVANEPSGSQTSGAIFFESKPNILLIVADDLGYTDLGAWGGEISTPNLDRLAREGVMFSNFHTHPSCAPTRAALMTGGVPHKAGLGTQLVANDTFIGDPHVDPRRSVPGYQGFLRSEVPTLPELLSDAGYANYMAGKWHLGAPVEQDPVNRGFDLAFSLTSGGATHFANADPELYRENGETLDSLPDDFYSTRYYTSKLIEYIEQGQDGENPWFAYAAYTSPHWPLQVPEDWLDLYEGQYDEGYDVLREQRIKAAIAAGLFDAGVAYEESAAPQWDSLSDTQRAEEARRMELYASMVSNLDHEVGRLLEYLRESNALENTVVIFMSDNGASSQGMSFLPRAPAKPPVIDNSFENYGYADSYLMYGMGWAQASMGPLRHYKGTVSAGGIRAPAFFWRPDINLGGEIEDSFLTVRDLTATILDIAGSSALADGRIDSPVADGQSFWTLVDEEIESTTFADRVLYWEHDGQFAVVKTDYKLVQLGNPHNARLGWGWALYNLREDPGETRNLINELPEVAQDLKAEFEHIRETEGVEFYPTLPALDI